MKKNLTAEQVYKHNQKWSKKLKVLAPICFWGCLALGILFVWVAFRNSFGNIAEIVSKLDKDIYTGEELQANYQYLLEKYGEWVIGNGGSGFEMTFVNIKRALFSGVMITSLIFAVVFFVSSYVLGKWLLPKLSQKITQDNQDMVNLEILKSKDEK